MNYSDKRKSTILVTGGTGFTGSALVLRLLRLGHRVRILDFKEGIMVDTLKKEGAEVVLGSITDKEMVFNLSKNVDIIFHIAAAFRELNVKNEHYFKVNVLGTRYVFEASYDHNVKKIIYCSTQGVHGHIINPPGNEDSPINPEDYYQQTKYEGELIAEEFVKKGMNVTIVRPTAIYGPGDPGRFLMIFKKVISGKFQMFGSGKTLYHPVYIDNLIDAFILLLDLKRGSGQTYIIGDDQFLSIKDLVIRAARAMDIELKIKHYPLFPLIVAGHLTERICKPLGITPPIFPRRVDWFRQNRAFDISKAKKELGYMPVIAIDEGLKRTAEWYVTFGYINPADINVLRSSFSFK